MTPAARIGRIGREAEKGIATMVINKAPPKAAK